MPISRRCRSETSAKNSGGAGSRIPTDHVGLDLSRPVSDGSPVGDGHDVASTSAVSIGVDLFACRKVEKRAERGTRETVHCARAMDPRARCANTS